MDRMKRAWKVWRSLDSATRDFVLSMVGLLGFLAYILTYTNIKGF